MPLPPSPILLIGLAHKVNILRIEDADDGFGGITSSLVPVLSNIRARITVMKDMDEQQGFGNVTGEHWKVLLPIVTNIENIRRSDLLNLSATSAVAPITRLNDEGNVQNYRILWVKQQIDEKGLFHHVSLAIEKEDQDN